MKHSAPLFGAGFFGLALALVIASMLPLAACRRAGFGGGDPRTAVPVDTARIHAAEVASWGYRREISADLDGDERLERVVIAADVSMGPAGPMWGNGHRWAVFVEPAKGERTLLYGALVPNGFAEAAVLAPDSEHRRKVLIQERTAQQTRALEVEYDHGRARLASGTYYQVGEWLPGAASLR
jgi:hypothetical protein